MSQQARTLQEVTTTLTPAEVLQAAKTFFARQNGIYAAFPEQQSATHITLRGQGGEEVVIAAVRAGDKSRVSGSTYLFDQQIARFFATLPVAPQSDVTEAAAPQSVPSTSAATATSPA